MKFQEIQSPRVDKISKSSLQFRQLIDSLRSNLKANRAPKQQKQKSFQHQVLQQTNPQTQGQRILSAPLLKASSQSNHFLLHNQQQNDLKPIEKIEIGDRDKLKKKPLLFDSNPELQQNHSKAINKLGYSTQLIQIKLANQTNAQIVHKAGVNVSTQYQTQNTSILNSSMAPRNNMKIGQIIKQNCKFQEPQAAPLEEPKKIKDINENVVIQYCKNEKKISSQSTPSQIFSFFANLIISCGIVIKSPHIKKYKNCIYFGFYIEKDLTYQGFLYFYDGKIYYGQFYNGFKHGYGVEINFHENCKMKGQFKDGHKTGKFYIESHTQKYIGYLQNGLYQGEGRLTKEDYVYQGMFEKGEKNGYGQEFYPKTGVRMTGSFKNGILQKVRVSKSIPQIQNKAKTFSLNKQKQKDRLQSIRKKSLQKHNFRMNKIRQRNFRDSEYQMQFQNSQLYNENKLNLNSNKFDVYRQTIQRLPKISHQFNNAHNGENNMDSIGSHHAPSRDFFPSPLRPNNLSDWQGREMHRMRTNQLQEPLPTPCLTVLRSKR